MQRDTTPISRDPRYSRELRHLMDLEQLSLRDYQETDP